MTPGQYTCIFVAVLSLTVTFALSLISLPTSTTVASGMHPPQATLPRFKSSGSPAIVIVFGLLLDRSLEREVERTCRMARTSVTRMKDYRLNTYSTPAEDASGKAP